MVENETTQASAACSNYLPRQIWWFNNIIDTSLITLFECSQLRNHSQTDVSVIRPLSFNYLTANPTSLYGIKDIEHSEGQIWWGFLKILHYLAVVLRHEWACWPSESIFSVCTMNKKSCRESLCCTKSCKKNTVALLSRFYVKASNSTFFRLIFCPKRTPVTIKFKAWICSHTNWMKSTLTQGYTFLKKSIFHAAICISKSQQGCRTLCQNIAAVSNLGKHEPLHRSF